MKALSTRNTLIERLFRVIAKREMTPRERRVLFSKRKITTKRKAGKRIN